MRLIARTITSIGARSAIERSKYKFVEKGNDRIVAVAPRITKIFIIDEPTRFPRAISGFHFFEAMTEVIISGALVPIATTVNPITACDTPSISAISTAQCTKNFPPITSKIILATTQKYDFATDSFCGVWSNSSGERLLCLTE